MKVLVTGSAGFIGSHLCEGLLKEGYEVICLDNFDPYYNPELKRKNIEPFLKDTNFTLVEGDIRDFALLEKIIKVDSIDYVMHNAAQPGVRASVENPMKPHEVNATGTLNLLRACLNSDVKKVINASSSSVYGEILYLPFDEEHSTNPISPYGISKLAAEHYCRVFYEIYRLNTVSLRLFTVYGPRMRPDLAISIFTSKALKNENIEIFGDGNKTRDFTYIDDVIKAYFLAMKRGDGQVYNIGSGNRISINELAEKIIEITESKSKIIYTNARKGDAEHTWANVEKAKRELGWKAETNIDSGLVKYVEWWKNEQKY